jgi:acyl-CoA hydrolase
MTILVTPDMVNFGGKIHGGALLKILDEVAYAYTCASRYSGHYVTMSRRYQWTKFILNRLLMSVS